MQTKYPGYHIVPASTWVKLTYQQQEALRGAGGFPVNDHFIQVWNRPATQKKQLLILYGTYGSSKTTDRIQELILECISDPYFKCYYGRQVFELAKKELHSSIISTLKDMRLAHLFSFSEAANGSKEITCVANGNKFKPFGCDDHESIKGWDNPTHIFIDEMNQIEFKSFGMLQSRLRKMGAKKCFVGCFNNCDVFEEHWIRTELLNKENPLKDDKGVPIQTNIIEHFSLYIHNYFLDHEDYRHSLIQQAGGDPTRVDAILNGQWGVSATGQPFYKMFNRSLHVAHCEYKPGLALHISWDENLNPYLPVGIFQMDGKNLYMIDEIAAKNPHNTLRWVCNEIYKRYGPMGKDHQAAMYVYGDATSRKDDVKQEKGRDFYALIREYLEYFKPKMRVDKMNPNVAMRGNFINAVFGVNYGGIFVTISPTCTHTIADFVNTSESPDGNGKDKTKTTVDGVRGVQRWGHFTDLFDYIMCHAFVREYSLFQTGGKRMEWKVGKRSPHNYF